MACYYYFFRSAVCGEHSKMEHFQTANSSGICRLRAHSCPNTLHSCSTLAEFEPHTHFTVIPGIMLAGVLFMYHHATSGLLQDEVSWMPLYKNSKKWDLCIVAFLVFLCSIFGLPYACGMLYQSQVHVRALTVKLHDYSDVEDQSRVVNKVQVQRVSGLGASLLSAAFLLPPIKRIITRIPLAILTGLLLQFTCSLYGSWDSMFLIVRFFHRKQVISHRRTSKSALCVYTMAHISCILITMMVSKTPAAVMFPLVILVTFWVRHSAMRNLFRKDEFAKLDRKLHSDFSDLSSSGQLSVASHDVHAHVEQAWPKISIPQTLNLKSAITVPMTDVHTAEQQNPATSVDIIQADSVAANGESPLPYAMSPSLLHASTRRLKERTHRRHKRKRQSSTDNAEVVSSEQQQDEHAPIPPLIKAMMQEQNSPSLHEQGEDINLSKRVSPRLSPQFFRKSKHGPRQEKPLEVHSNLLYEPKRQARKSMQTEEPVTSIAEEIENDIQSANQRQEILRFQASPGIGRCIRSPPVFKNQSPIGLYKKKHLKNLKLSIAISRTTAFPKEEIYPVNVGADDPPRKPCARLRRSSTSRWPTTQIEIPLSHHQPQRHSTSISKHEIAECEV
ncbi:hypothetical protein L7F22_065111 [Adiantum nelumboides]|nr:hypothetical protein [Adiantum nelumboides]